MNQLVCKAMCKMHAQKGVTMIEYVLIASLIAIVAIGLMTTVGTEIQAAWQKVIDAL